MERTHELVPLSGYNFAHMISLGSHYYPSAVFQRLGLKRYSCPFDWMFTTPKMVQACIESDFKQFLDRQYYAPFVWQGKTTYKHTYYDTYWQANFTHYDPLSDDGHDYLERCVNRFRQVLATPDPKLFLFVVSIHAFDRDKYVDQFNDLNAAIASRSDTSTVIGVTVSKGEDEPEILPVARSGPSSLFHFSATSLLKGINFENPIDDKLFDDFVIGLAGGKQTERLSDSTPEMAV